jgi:hypothetical protein
MMQSVQFYELPYPFPPGKAWAAIRFGTVMNMVYMTQQPGDLVPYGLFRHRARAALAMQGVVWSGTVSVSTGDGRAQSRFMPDFESTDIRHTGECNTARIFD